MKRATAVLIVFILTFGLSSCARERNAYNLLSDFIGSYSAEGVIYSPGIREGEDGYITDEAFKKIYVLYGEVPENYAIFLNSHADYGSECAVFVCRDESERARVSEMCEERMRLLCANDKALLLRSGNVVFYSTMRDRERAERIWRQILISDT